MTTRPDRLPCEKCGSFRDFCISDAPIETRHRGVKKEEGNVIMVQTNIGGGRDPAFVGLLGTHRQSPAAWTKPGFLCYGSVG